MPHLINYTVGSAYSHSSESHLKVSSTTDRIQVSISIWGKANNSHTIIILLVLISRKVYRPTSFVYSILLIQNTVQKLRRPF